LLVQQDSSGQQIAVFEEYGTDRVIIAEKASPFKRFLASLLVLIYRTHVVNETSKNRRPLLPQVDVFQSAKYDEARLVLLFGEGG
jgi:hypothetical protein